MSSTDVYAFFKNLDKIDWDSTNVKNVDFYGSSFLHIFNQVLVIHAPVIEIKISKREDRRNAKSWITNDIVKLKTKLIKYSLKRKT